MSSKLVNIPEWAKGFNDTLFDVIVGEIRVENRLDRTISIQQMIAVLENTPIFKDNNEKMIYLEKIQKWLGFKKSLLKKDARNQLGTIQEIDRQLKSNENFGYIMNYELTASQFSDFLFVCVSRRITSSGQDDLKGKYKESIDAIIQSVTKIKAERKVNRLTLKTKNIVTDKDRAKQKMIQEH